MHSTTLSADINIQAGTNELIPSVAVDRVIAQRNSGVEMFMQGIKALQEAETLLAAAAGRDWFWGMAKIVESGLSGSRSAEEEAIRRRLPPSASLHPAGSDLSVCQVTSDLTLCPYSCQ
ncbi:hypothetical protein M9289_004631 [Salmonella enterica]|nr:hypothetical protein [Salmonella enterica]